MPLRFTIRDLLWLTALVAMGVARWVDRSRLSKLLDSADAEFRAAARIRIIKLENEVQRLKVQAANKSE